MSRAGQRRRPAPVPAARRHRTTVRRGLTDAMTRDWDARTYDRVAAPMTQLGRDRPGPPAARRRRARARRRLRQRPGDRDARRTTAARSVVALDGSAAMVDAARERLARFGDRVDYVVADLGSPLPIEGHVDAILSTATFHWVPDHDALFRNLAAVTRPGGRLVAQCGGVGNIASVRRVLGADRRRLAGQRPLRDAAGDRPPARRGRLRRHRVLADRRAEAVRAGRAVRDVPADGRPRRPPGAHPGRRAGRVRPRGRGRAAGRRHRLRPAQHRRPPVEPLSVASVSRGPGTRRRGPG